MTKLYPGPQKPSQEIRRDRRLIAIAIPVIALVLSGITLYLFPFRKNDELLHVSYDASREYYAILNQTYLQSPEGLDQSRISMNHAGSVRQAHNLAHLQIADVVSLASAYDLQTVIDRDGCLDPDWQHRHPFESAPFHSTLALVVRKGNPKQIHDWPDLWRRDVKLAFPSPSHSGAGRWAFLALQTESSNLAHSPTSGTRKLQEIFLRSTPLDAGARTALSLFANCLDLDALLTWESDALQLAELGFSQLDAIHFPRSILASPHIAVLRCYTEKRKITKAAEAYVAFQFSSVGQRLAAQNHLRPSDPTVALAYADRFPPTEQYSVPEEAWSKAFSDTGSYEQLKKLRSAQQGGHE